MPANTTCPHCDRPASGTYCAECGVRLQASACPECGSDLRPGVRFCHMCGTPLGGRRGQGLGAGVWAGVGVVAVAALAAGGTWFVQQRPEPATAAQTRPVPTAPVAAAPDISNLTPREQADRLFNRIMEASERGDSAAVSFFRPMALEAYNRLGTLDADARYHVGLIHALVGDFTGVETQLDSLSREAPGHLLGALLAYTLSNLRDDAAGRERAFVDFLDAYETEIASGKPEYSDHEQALQAFAEQARATTGRE